MYREEFKKIIDKIKNIDGIYIWLIILILPPLINIYIIPLIPITISYTITSLIHGTYNSEVYDSIKNNLGELNYFIYYLLLFFIGFSNILVNKTVKKYGDKFIPKGKIIERLRAGFKNQKEKKFIDHIVMIHITTVIYSIIVFLFLNKFIPYFFLSVADIFLFILLYFVITYNNKVASLIFITIKFIIIGLYIVYGHNYSGGENNFLLSNSKTALIILVSIYIFINLKFLSSSSDIKENRLIKKIPWNFINFTFAFLLFLGINIFTPQLNNELTKGIKPTDSYLFFTSEHKEKAREIFEKLSLNNIASENEKNNEVKYWFDKVKLYDVYGNNGLIIEGVCYLWKDKDYYYFGNFNKKNNRFDSLKIDSCNYNDGDFRLIKIPFSDNFSVNKYQLVKGGNTLKKLKESKLKIDYFYDSYHKYSSEIKNDIAECLYILNGNNIKDKCHFFIGDKIYRDYETDTVYYDKIYLNIIKDILNPNFKGSISNKYNKSHYMRIEYMYDTIFKKQSNINLDLFVKREEIKDYIKTELKKFNKNVYFKKLKEEVSNLELLNFEKVGVFNSNKDENKTKLKLIKDRSFMKNINLKEKNLDEDNFYEGNVCGEFYFNGIVTKLPVIFTKTDEGYKSEVNKEAIYDLTNFKNIELFGTCD